MFVIAEGELETVKVADVLKGKDSPPLDTEIIFLDGMREELYPGKTQSGVIARPGVIAKLLIMAINKHRD